MSEAGEEPQNTAAEAAETGEEAVPEGDAPAAEEAAPEAEAAPTEEPAPPAAEEAPSAAEDAPAAAADEPPPPEAEAGQADLGQQEEVAADAPGADAPAADPEPPAADGPPAPAEEPALAGDAGAGAAEAEPAAAAEDAAAAEAEAAAAAGDEAGAAAGEAEGGEGKLTEEEVAAKLAALEQPEGPPALYGKAGDNGQAGDADTPAAEQAADAAPTPAAAEAPAPAKAAPAPPAEAPKAAKEPAATDEADAEPAVTAKVHPPAARSKSSRAKDVESLGDAVHPPSPSKMKSSEPWLEGTFRTVKGRIITAQELCQSVERMTTAHISKYLAMQAAAQTVGPSPANGTVFNTKQLNGDELETMVSRLYTAKSRDEALSEAGRMELVQLKFDDNGKEQWVPVKKSSLDEQKEYLCALYDRCLETKKKTEEELAAKYLQPLGKPKKV